MNRVRHLLLSGPILTALSVCAAAQEGQRVQISLTPYLWIAGVSGTLGTGAGSNPDARVDADFGDVLSNLNAIPLMVAGEIRQGRFGLMADIMAISVEADADTPGPVFSGGEARLRGIVGSALATWRVAETERAALDLGLGLRAFGTSTRFTLEPGLLQGRRIERDANWVNPIVGLRYRHDLGAGWATTLYGDHRLSPQRPYHAPCGLPLAELRAGWRGAQPGYRSGRPDPRRNVPLLTRAPRGTTKGRTAG
jgi:hypothetical protein